MENLRLRIMALIAALFLSALTAGADALSMGALAKSYAASANPGDVAAFTLLFWNIESEPYGVELSSDAVPEDWSIIFDPKSFALDSKPSGKTEYIYLPYLKKSVEAKVVDVYIHIPENAAAGRYFVSAVATTKPSGGSVQVNFVGQKKFAFEIIVGRAENTKGSALNQSVVIENPGILETVSLDLSGKQQAVTVENPGTFALFSSDFKNATNTDSMNWGRKPFFASVAAILIVAWVIYRYE